MAIIFLQIDFSEQLDKNVKSRWTTQGDLDLDQQKVNFMKEFDCCGYDETTIVGDLSLCSQAGKNQNSTKCKAAFIDWMDRFVLPILVASLVLGVVEVKNVALALCLIYSDGWMCFYRSSV